MTQKFKYINSAVGLYNASKVLQSRSPIGASMEEILKLEEKLNLKLPQSYREYLLWMGNDRNGLFQGTDCFVDDVIENIEYLDKIITDEKLTHFELQQSICFSSHQGYDLHWFYVNTEDNNPMCYEYAETPEGIFFEQIGCFTKVLYKLVTSGIQSWEDALFFNTDILPRKTRP